VAHSVGKCQPHEHQCDIHLNKVWKTVSHGAQQNGLDFVQRVAYVMAFTVYILHSRVCDKYYTGQTTDFVNRLGEHNSGQTKSIKRCVPWQLVWQTEVTSRGEAMKLENKIKKRGAARFIVDWNRAR
jgi:putative endonuclease